MKHIFGILLIIILAGCELSNRDELPPGDRTGGFKMANETQLSQVIQLMAENDIPYYVDEKGFVIYLLKDKAEVLGIQREIWSGKKLRDNVWESAVITTDYAKGMYESAFREQSIPYKIEEREGFYEIRWSQLYGPKADIIIEQVETAVRDYYYEKATNK